MKKGERSWYRGPLHATWRGNAAPLFAGVAQDQDAVEAEPFLATDAV